MALYKLCNIVIIRTFLRDNHNQTGHLDAHDITTCWDILLHNLLLTTTKKRCLIMVLAAF